MKLSFDLNVDDWVAFQQYYRGKKTPLYNVVYPLLLILGVLSIAIFVYNIIVPKDTTTFWVSGVCILVLMYVLYIRKKSLYAVKKAGMDIQEKNPEAFGPMILETDANGITIQSQKSSKAIAWSDLGKLEENKLYFFLYSKKGVVYIIPKRGMEDLSGLRGELTNNIE